MPWPPKVQAGFTKLPTIPSEADFHGPYNKLLYTLFPADSDFTVVPHYLPGSRESADFIVMFEVLLEDKPVLVLELKAPARLQYPSTREDADLQIRTRLRDLAPCCPLPVLYGVCAMGTQLCFYKKPRNEPIAPPRIPPDLELQIDTAPEARWDCNILEEEGEQRFRRMVDEINQGCAAL